MRLLSKHQVLGTGAGVLVLRICLGQREGGTPRTMKGYLVNTTLPLDHSRTVLLARALTAAVCRVEWLESRVDTSLLGRCYLIFYILSAGNDRRTAPSGAVVYEKVVRLNKDRGTNAQHGAHAMRFMFLLSANS